MSAGRVLIFNSSGTLAAKCVEHYKANGYWVLAIDKFENRNADQSLVTSLHKNLTDQQICDWVGAALNDQKLDAIIFVANSYPMNRETTSLLFVLRGMLLSSSISYTIATQYLKKGGILIWAAPLADLEHIPGVGIEAYDLVRTAVHILTHGLQEAAVGVAILPIKLDTPRNRRWLSNAGSSNWTPLEFVVDVFWKWTRNCDRPPSGKLVRLVTKNFISDTVLV